MFKLVPVFIYLFYMGAEGVSENDACLDQSDLGILKGFGHLNGKSVVYGSQNFLLTVWQGPEQAYLTLGGVGAAAKTSAKSFGCEMKSGELHAVNGWSASDVRAFLNGVQLEGRGEVA